MSMEVVIEDKKTAKNNRTPVTSFFKRLVKNQNDGIIF